MVDGRRFLCKGGKLLTGKALEESASTLKRWSIQAGRTGERVAPDFLKHAADAPEAALKKAARVEAANDVIDDAYRVAANRKTVAESFISRHMIDMNNAPPSSVKTSLGFNRNGPWFWRELLKKNGEMFSEANKRLIRQGKSPIVDDEWLKFNPQHGEYLGDKLIHHHIDQGRFASGLPERLHRQLFPWLHSRTTN